MAGDHTLGCGYSGDLGPATSAQIRNPAQIALDAQNNLYIADYGNCRVREVVHATGIIKTIAGVASCGYSGDGVAISNDINQAQGVWSDPNGNVFISDTNNFILRWVTPTGQLTTFAGTPSSAGFAGDGGPALSAKFYYPEQITQDSSGNIYVADEYNFRVRKVTPFAGFGLSTASLNFETQPAGTTSDFQPIMWWRWSGRPRSAGSQLVPTSARSTIVPEKASRPGKPAKSTSTSTQLRLEE